MFATAGWVPSVVVPKLARTVPWLPECPPNRTPSQERRLPS